MHELEVFSLHVLVSFGKLVILEGQLEYLLAGGTFGLCRFLPVVLVHTKVGFVLGSRARHAPVVLMDRLQVLLVLL